MDKMREEFEVWANGQGYATYKYDESELSDKYKHLAGTYVIPETRLMIEVWKASRASICVELNSVIFSRCKNCEGGLMLPERVFKAMDEAGVSYK